MAANVASSRYLNIHSPEFPTPREPVRRGKAITVVEG